jgi:hypothetical protein
MHKHGPIVNLGVPGVRYERQARKWGYRELLDASDAVVDEIAARNLHGQKIAADRARVKAARAIHQAREPVLE